MFVLASSPSLSYFPISSLCCLIFLPSCFFSFSFFLSVFLFCLSFTSLLSIPSFRLYHFCSYSCLPSTPFCFLSSIVFSYCKHFSLLIHVSFPGIFFSISVFIKLFLSIFLFVLLSYFVSTSPLLPVFKLYDIFGKKFPTFSLPPLSLF